MGYRIGLVSLLRAVAGAMALFCLVEMGRSFTSRLLIKEQSHALAQGTKIPRNDSLNKESSQERSVTDMVITTLKQLRRQLIDTGFLLSLYRDDSKFTVEPVYREDSPFGGMFGTYRIKVGEEQVMVPKFVLSVDSLPLSFSELIPVEIQERVRSKVQQHVFPLLPKTVTFKMKIWPTERRIDERKEEIFRVNIAGEMPFYSLHRMVNQLIHELDPGAPLSLSVEEKVEFVLRVHKQPYQEIHERRGRELFHHGHWSYTQSSSTVAIQQIKNLKENDYLGPGKKFVDLGSGEGLITHLVNAITGAESTGIEGDEGLNIKAQLLTGPLSTQGAIDKDKIHWIRASFFNEDFLAQVPEYDALYIYPPMNDFGVAVDLTPIIKKMKPGAILVPHLTDIEDLCRSWHDYLEPVQEIGYRRKEQAVAVVDAAL